LHRLASSFVLGYHGCDRTVAEKLLSGAPFEESKNEYDWLGWGIYFWEANPLRALEFAHDWKARGKYNEPYLVGAAIDLGYCLDLTSSTGVQIVKSAYEDFAHYVKAADEPLPTNRLGKDRLLRALDCAVLNHLHKVREKLDQQPFDSVKGIFLEGDEIYPNAGFYDKTHIQICVRSPSSIKGIFRVPEGQLRV
jgi:hypothetical protein